jgi:hypothetical protein
VLEYGPVADVICDSIQAITFWLQGVPQGAEKAVYSSLISIIYGFTPDCY